MCTGGLVQFVVSSYSAFSIESGEEENLKTEGGIGRNC